MNLKEAFRFQNKLQAILGEAIEILSDEDNITKVQRTYFRKKVMAEAENETVADEPKTEYSENITEMTGFMLWLIELQEQLYKSIRAAKAALPIDMDAEVSLNKQRQHTAFVLRAMTQLRASEVLQPNGGTGYRFNTDGNQVSYRCDMKKVTTINFDRGVVRKELLQMNKHIDEISDKIDRCLVNAEVAFEVPFDVNDSFADVFTLYLAEVK